MLYSIIKKEVNLFIKHLTIDLKVKEGHFLKRSAYPNRNLYGDEDPLQNGSGKLYDESGKLKFEGEFLNDKKDGQGIEYYSNGQIKELGSYKDDRHYGKMR